MTGNPKIYSASYDVVFGVLAGQEHAYLYYDPDFDGDNDPTTGTGMEIIRGGPAGPIHAPGKIEIEAGVNAFDNSEDRFEIDRNLDGQADTPADRNFREIFSGNEATQRWTQFETTAQALATENFNPVENTGTSNTDYYVLGELIVPLLKEC